MKVINYLLGYKNLRIVQDNEMFNFSLDSVLLPNFVTLNKNITKILDIGSGNAPIPLILSTKTNVKITGVEIQKEVYNMALDSIKLNNKQEQIDILNKDINDYYREIETDTFDVITCNPPFFKYTDDSYINLSYEKTVARHEVLINLEEVVKISSSLLKSGGNLAMVHRTDRLLDVLSSFKKYNIEPKRLIFVYNKLSKGSILFFIEGQKNGNGGLKIEKPFIVYNEDNSYTEEYSYITKEVLK